LSNTCSLRQNGKVLDQIREQLFTLWGNLEELKSDFLKTSVGMGRQNGLSISPLEPAEGTNPLHKATGEVLPPDSDDEKISSPKSTTRVTSEHAYIADRTLNVESTVQIPDSHAKIPSLQSSILALPVANKGFACCVRQYGVKVTEVASSKADAGVGLRWERVLGLFGTKIT
jgi:protection-of-telomeres protein 1